MLTKEQFERSSGYKNWAMGLTAVGVIALIAGFVLYGRGDEHHQVRFWATLMHNSIFWLLVVNASMFFIAVTTLAMGGWQTSFRRVPEAISACVPVIGLLAVVVLLSVVFTHQHHIYHWLDTEHVKHDPILNGKSGFLNAKFYTIWTLLTVGLWTILGANLRKFSYANDEQPITSAEEGKKWIFTGTVKASLFTVWFALTVGSTTPWLWIMSIDAHWYSTMFSWYNFASSFVSGMSLIALYVVYLKNKGLLKYTTEEHLHDIGKFMFAFSVFWTYLWFSQYMLIWYANIPEETVYFQPRANGPYKGIFFLNLIINFVAPLLILMKRGVKRNYTLITIMAVVIIFGHWLDFYQMVFPSLLKEHVELNLFDFGVAAGFVGLIMLITGRQLEKHSLIPVNHPFLKESIIHHT